MLLDVIAIGLLAVFVAMGAWRGSLVSGTHLVSILLAYGGGMLAAGRLAEPVASRLGVAEFYGAGVAGILGFIAAFLLAGLLGSLLRSWDASRRGDDPRFAVDRVFGALLGGVRGGLVVLLLSWLAVWLDAARDLEAVAGLDAVPQTEGSNAARVTKSAVAEVVGLALDPGGDEAAPGARLVARLTANPGPALAGLQELLADDRIGELQQDKLFWTLIENGASERALNRLSFYAISHDDGMRERLADLGIVSPEAREDVEVFRDEARTVFEQVGPRLQGLREDPEIQQLARNPEILRLLENGDTLALINRPEIQGIVDRISRGMGATN